MLLPAREDCRLLVLKIGAMPWAVDPTRPDPLRNDRVVELRMVVLTRGAASRVLLNSHKAFLEALPTVALMAESRPLLPVMDNGRLVMDGHTCGTEHEQEIMTDGSRSDHEAAAVPDNGQHPSRDCPSPHKE